MSGHTDIAIVGAGPYGLSTAAYLRRLGIAHRIVGTPMEFWRAHMPKGMLLKSEGLASNMFDPDGRFTLRRFCNERGINYADLGLPVTLETFIDYGLDFQQRAVPELETDTVVSISSVGAGFRLDLTKGEPFNARRVVIATGLSHYDHLPAEIAGLPREFVSHSSQHSDVTVFAGREVAVIGAGASASDLAILFQEAGARVHLVARGTPWFHAKMQLPRPLWDQIRHPISGIGPGWRSRFYQDGALIFHYFPAIVRHRVVRRHLGPAGGWFMKDRFASVSLFAEHQIQTAKIVGDRVKLEIADKTGGRGTLWVDHVVGATGYNVDVNRLPFLSNEIRSKVRRDQTAPELSSTFESSVPGLYFIGAATANSFGPLVRFAVGAQFSVRRLTRHLSRSLQKTLTAAERRSGRLEMAE
jgi:hypothetical protein